MKLNKQKRISVCRWPRRSVYLAHEYYTDKQFLNIGTGEDISIKELAYLVKDIVWYTGELVFDTTKPDGMPKKLLDISKITQTWWKYTTDFIKWLKNSYNYFLEIK